MEMSQKRGELKRLAVFVAVAEGGGFTAAAARLGTTKAMVSAQVRQLEAELGVTLFTRTTRRVTLTEAGQQLQGECTPLLRELEAALDRVGDNGVGELRGTLRLTAAHDVLSGALSARLARFAALHPALHLDLVATDQVLDLVGEGIDVAIRGGWLRDSTLRAVRLDEFEQYVCAASSYLAAHGIPRQPQELAEHRWVALTLLRAPLTWTFVRKGAQRTVRMQAAARANAPGTVQALVREGLGLSILASFAVEQDLAQGRLVRLLGDWTLPRAGIHAVYPATRHVPAKVRALVDFLREPQQPPRRKA